MAYSPPSIQKRNEARKLLQAQGLEPTPAQVSEKQRRLLQEENFRQAQKKVEATKAKAFERKLDTDTPSAFAMQLEQILRGELEPQQQALAGATRGVVTDIVGLPGTIGEIPGFGGLSLQQARRLQDIEASGLGSLVSGLTGLGQQRQRRLEQLTEQATGAFRERQGIAEQQRRELGIQQQKEFQQQLELSKLALQIPKGEELTVGDITIKGIQPRESSFELKEDPNTGNLITFDKKTGQIAAPGTTRADRNNNPLNIKSSEFTKQFSGVFGIDQKPALDGGFFLQFDSPESGFNAAKTLWRQGKSYKNVNIDIALKRWSGEGYGGEIAEQVGIDSNRPAQSLSERELESVLKAMSIREGYHGFISAGEIQPVISEKSANQQVQNLLQSLPIDMQRFYSQALLAPDPIAFVKNTLGEKAPQNLLKAVALTEGIAGRAGLSTEERKRIKVFQSANVLANMIGDLLKDIPAGKGPEQFIMGPITGLKAKTKFAPQVNAYISFKRAVAIPIIRAIGEVGNLSQTEQQAALNLLPSVAGESLLAVGDSIQERQQKLKNLKALIKTLQAGAMGELGIPQSQIQRIRVRLKTTGQTGTIEENEFDPNIYTRISP